MDFTNDFPDYETLFWPTDLEESGQSSSFLPLEAYLIDLLQFREDEFNTLGEKKNQRSNLIKRVLEAENALSSMPSPHFSEEIFKNRILPKESIGNQYIW
ncbi:hypothetical protein [Xanthovirga aplysinae]|uniref:hypothetical protein n=1 Tax=Xanthovirga aplysinae TaxID=2529853 RepID=UPI0012BBE03C|nr:hypothetical protein [Xanthovirga aplysinae]MTI29866.1 hypothetical protein [Xanthovirga aplysinae]